MPPKILVGLLLSALMFSLGGCGGGGSGGSGAPSSTPEPVAGQPLEVAPPVVTPSPPTLAPPTLTTPVTPAPVAPVVVTPAPVTSAPVALAPVTPVPVTSAPVATVPPAAPVVVPSSGSVTSANSCGLGNFQTDVMAAINAARAQSRSCGSEAKPAAAALEWNDTLFSAATAHSQDMAQRNYFSHTSPDGKTLGDRALTAGYRFSAIGENIAAGQGSVAVVMQGWIASEGHCRNIMTAAFTQVAVACVTTSRQQYPTYWTMVLGKPQ